MNPNLCSLLLWLYPRSTGDAYLRITIPDFCAELPEAERRGLVESPPTGDALDTFFVRLTKKGVTAALEGKCAMEEVA